MSKGGGGGGKTTTTTEPPKYLQPFLQEGMQGAKNIYNGGPQQYYPGQTVVGFSPETESALGMQSQRAQNGSPVMGAANNYATSTLNGGATNPYLDATFNQGADQIMNRLKTDFAGSGRNTGAAMPVASEQLGSFGADLYGGAYDADQTRRLGVLGMAPQLANQDYTDINALRDVGSTREDLSGRQMQDTAARWDFGQNAQGNSLDQYLARLQGYPGGVTSQQTPIYQNHAAGALGGAGLGSQIGGQFGGNGGMYGAVLGGLLGYGG